MYDALRFVVKKIIFPAADGFIKILPKRVRVLLLASSADSLKLKNVRFDAPMTIGKDAKGKPPVWLNIGLFPNDRSVVPSILVNGEWESSEPLFVADNVQKDVNYVLFDVGANFGMFSLQLIELLKDGDGNHPIQTIHLFEPDSTITPILEANIQQLKSDKTRVNVIEKAIGKEKGSATFYLDDANKANNSLASTAMDRAVSGVTEVQVEVLAADDILKDFPIKRDQRIIYKSDLQGIDPDIVSIIPMDFWNLVDVMIIELWPQVLKDYEFSTDDFKAAIQQFDIVILEEFGKKREIDVSEIDGIISSAADHQYFNLLCARSKK